MQGDDFTVRKAAPEDAEDFISLVLQLADYEKLRPPGREEIERLKEDAFGPSPRFELLMAFSGEEAIAYAVYFMTYSTFLALPTLYLEDIFVRPSNRREGVGRRIFARLASTAKERGCGRMEWSVLKWNSMALDFYRKMGAEELKEWTYYRMTEKVFERIAGQ